MYYVFAQNCIWSKEISTCFPFNFYSKDVWLITSRIEEKLGNHCAFLKTGDDIFWRKSRTCNYEIEEVIVGIIKNLKHKIDTNRVYNSCDRLI